MTSCETIETWIALEQTESLRDAERVGLEAHLTGCEACVELRRAVAALGTETLAVDAPKAVETRGAFRRVRAAALVAVAAACAAGMAVFATRPVREDATREPPPLRTANAALRAPAEAERPASATTAGGASDHPRPFAPPLPPLPPGATADATIARGGNAIAALLGQPGTGGGSGGAAPPADGNLNAADVERVIRANRSNVRKACWEPHRKKASDLRLSTVRVQLSLTIAPDGSVRTAAATTNAAELAAVGACTAAQARTWRFPPSNGPAQVAVPFLYAVPTEGPDAPPFPNQVPGPD